MKNKNTTGHVDDYETGCLLYCAHFKRTISWLL